MANQYVLVEREEGIVTLTMHDPPTLNAWNLVMGRELLDELVRAEESAEDRVVILTGSGQRGFNSGANMKEMAERGSITATRDMSYREQQVDPFERFDPPLTPIQKVTWQLRNMRKPTIAAVNGAAAGGGMGLAAACDIRIASENAKFTSVFVRRGLVPDEGSMYLLRQIIGESRAREVMLTGRLFDAHEAERMGFVSRVVPVDRLLEEAKALARDIVAYCPPITTGLIKTVLNRSIGLDFRQTMRLADAAFNTSVQTEDHREAVRAYAERRAPRFQGR